VLAASLGWLLVHVTMGWAASLVATGGVLRAAARLVLDFIAVVVSVALALFGSLTLASPLSATALERLVRIHDERVGAPAYPRTPWITSASRALGASLLGLAVSIPVTLVVTIVDALFPPAAVVLVPLGTLVSGYVIAWNLLDYPLGLRAVTLGERARWMASRVALVTGFALSSSLLLLVPGLGLLLLPAGVVGAAMVVDGGKLPAPPSSPRLPSGREQ